MEDVQDEMVQEVMAQKGYLDWEGDGVDFVELRRGEFLMPGFVDTHTVSLHHIGVWKDECLSVSLWVLACASDSEYWKVSTLVRRYPYRSDFDQFVVSAQRAAIRTP